MREIVEKLSNLNEADENYSINVDTVSVYVDGLKDGEEEQSPDSIRISYDIEIEYRDWGIKDITVTPRGRVEFDVEIVDAEDNHVDTIEVLFDFDAVDWHIDWLPGSGYAAESLTIRINREGGVEDVAVGFYYPSH